jgi:hypothetical protein
MQPLLDYAALENLDSEIASRDSNVFYMKQQDIEIGKPIHIRFLPPKPDYNGRYYITSINHWLQVGDKKVKVVSPKIIPGEHDFIDMCIDSVKVSMDSGAKALVANQKLYDKQQIFLLPAIILDDVRFGPTGEAIYYKVRNGKPCIFQCGPQVLKQINAYVINPQYANASGLSILSPSMGSTLTISKAKSGQKTDYLVQAWKKENAVDEALVESCENIIDQQKRQMYSDAYQQSIFTHFLTGRPTMAEPEYRFPDLRQNTVNPEVTTSVPSFIPQVNVHTPAPQAAFQVPQVTPQVATVQVPQVNVPAVPPVAAPVAEQPAASFAPSVQAPVIDLPQAVPPTNIGGDINDLPTNLGKPANLFEAVQASLGK